MPRLGKALLLSVLLLVAFASAAMADVTVSPSSGPPGTVVTVSGITTCETGGAPQTLTFENAADRSIAGPRVPFTPPSGTLIVPDLPDGDYNIALSCGAGEGFVVFAVRATPAFTG